MGATYFVPAERSISRRYWAVDDSTRFDSTDYSEFARVGVGVLSRAKMGRRRQYLSF